jgi:WD40 repeat protein
MKYWAFLSYSHTDRKWGDWLHKALETYRVPRRLIGNESRDGKIPSRLFPIFRDREELPVSADLGSNINEALRESRYLIVICSPRSAQSRWVGEEIKSFKKLGCEDRILALIVDGEPNASDGKPGFKIEDECFHEAMRYRFGSDGAFTSERTEPVAADAREDKDGKANAKLKLLAGLLGINYDDLKQREQERRSRRARFIAVVATVLLVSFGALAGWATSAANLVRSQKVASDLNHAQELFDQNNATGAILYLARAVELDRAKHSIPAERLWFALTERSWPIPLSVPMRHEDGILSACFSPDGGRILTASRDKSARLWDANSGKQLGAPLSHPRLVRRAMFTPNGQSIVTIGFDGIARLWDATSSQAMPQWRIEHDDSINAVAITSDGKWISTGSADGTVRVSDLAGGRRVAEMRESENVHTLVFEPGDDSVLLGISGKTVVLWKLPEGRRLFELAHEEQVNSAEFSPDGKGIITASDDRSCRLWDAKTGRPIGEELKHNAEVRNAFYSSNGELIASLAGDQIVVWTVQDKIARKYLLQHQRSVSCARFAPDNLVIFSGTEDGSVQAWNLLDGKTFGEPIREASAIVSIALDKDGKRLLVTTGNATARTWHPPARNPLAERFAHKARVESVSISRDGQVLLTTSDDNTGRLWNLEKRDEAPKSLVHKSAVLCGAISPDARYALTGSADQTARLWRTDSGDAVGEALVHTAAVSQVAFSRDGNFFATATDSGSAQFWELSSRNALGKPMNHNARVSAIEFSHDSKLFLTAGSDAKVELWASRTGEGTGAPLRAAKEITCAHFAPSQDVVAAGAGDGAVYLWSTSTRKLLKQIAVGSTGVSALAFAPDGHAFAAACGDTAAIWSVSTGRQIGQSLRHTSPVTAVQFSGSSGRVATGEDSGAVRLWDASIGLALSEKLSHGNGIRGLVFSPNGRVLFSCSRDRAVRAWDVSTGVTPTDQRELAKLARAISCLRINNAGQLESREVESLSDLNSQLKTLSGSARVCAQWMLADPADRTLTPNSGQSLAGYVKKLVLENDDASRDEAVFFSEKR